MTSKSTLQTKNHKRGVILLLAVLLLALGTWVSAQENNYYKVVELNPQNTGQTNLLLPLPISATGFALELTPLPEPTDSFFILAGNDSIPFVWNSETGASPISGFIGLNAFIDTVRLIVPYPFTGSLHVFNGSGGSKKKALANTDYPFAVVPTSEWRKDLPDPVAGRTFTQTTHLIVHHSATNVNNHLTDVRNIYLYHTQTHLWDDIGYNFLIARDGTIYQGRDGLGLETDYVMGAHFCGKNTNTMGICMLGTLHEYAPTTEALESLTALLAWKTEKDALSPLAITEHSRDPGNLLPVIAGHRDGCATECPGSFMYAALDDVRLDVAAQLGISGVKIMTEANIHNWEGIDERTTVDIYSLQGCLMAHGQGLHFLAGLPKGAYILKAQQAGQISMLYFAR